MDEQTTLKTPALASAWSVGERQVRNVLAQLEALGFQLEVDNYGGRALALPVALATKAARQAGIDLATLRDRPDLARYLRPDAAPAEDPFTDLVELRTELSIVREVLARTLDALSGGSIRSSYTAPQNWAFLGLPNPKRGL